MGNVTGTKDRLILDPKRSRSNEAALAPFRIVLPRPTDAVNDALRIQRHALRQGLTTIGGIIWLVLDVADAYWLIPLHPEERRFQCAMWMGKWIVFKRTGQGTKASSLTWSHISAALSRLLQPLFTSEEAALETYSDDPLLAIAGSTATHDRLAAIFISALIVLGLHLSFHKG